MIRKDGNKFIMSIVVFGVLGGCAKLDYGDVQTESQVTQTDTQASFTDEQIGRLADRILENTPEYVHFAEGTEFSWVYLETATQTAPESLQRAVLDRLREQYTVYLLESEIPRHQLIEAKDGQLGGYKDGFRFSYRIEPEAERTIKVHYSDYEGDLAASLHWKRYRWTGNDWEIIEVGPMLIS